MDVTFGTAAGLGVVALVAGFVDAIGGGGGLLTVPALMTLGLDSAHLLATNKGQSVFGSGMALVRFAHSPLLDRSRVLVSLLPGVLAAAGGAALVSYVPERILRPVIIGLLAAVAVFMVFYRVPAVHRPRRPWTWAAAGLLATGLAFYDGCFGPGTGTFLILAYVLFFHEPLDEASANAKVVNFASNLGALALFAWRGMVLWKLALPMAVGQAIGGYCGAHVTVRVGRGLVRWTVVAMSLALIGWQVRKLFP